MNENNWFFNRKMLWVVTILTGLTACGMLRYEQGLWTAVCGSVVTAVSLPFAFILDSNKEQK